MLHNVDTLMDMVLEATDGDIGRCEDFLFDDQAWAVRYMLADTRKWLPGRQVLVSSESLEGIDLLKNRIRVNLSREAIRESPTLEEEAPVSRQYQARLADHYGLRHWWVGPGGHGVWPAPIPLHIDEDMGRAERDTDTEDSHLRSAREVGGYRIQAPDQEIGHLETLLVEDDGWEILFFVVDTRNWLPGRKVVLPKHWAKGVSWLEEAFYVNQKADRIEACPDIDLTRPVDPRFASELRSHFNP